MMRYVPTSELAVARALSDSLWALTRPPQVRQEKDTQHMFATVTMTDGSVWLAADDEFNIRLHPEAELGGIAAVMQPWIDEGSLPPSTNTDLAVLVESLRGQSLTPWEAFPQLFKDQAKTADELRKTGLLPSLSTMIDHPDTLNGPHFDSQLFGPGPRRLHKGGGKPKGPSASQIALEKAQLELSRKQLMDMEAMANKPTPAAPAPLAAMAPTASQTSADADQAAAEERRKALKRMAPARSTIFAGESKSTLGGGKTLLG